MSMQTPTRTIAMLGSAEKKQESKDAQKVMRALAQHLRALGFERTKPSFFTRPRQLVVEFVHIHKYTFGPYFRVHLGVRVKNDEHDGANLNGPCFDRQGDPARGGREFEYSSLAESHDTCAQTMAEFIGSVGCDWFHAFAEPQALLSAPGSPLNERQRAFLELALQRPTEASTSKATMGVLGIQ